MKFLIATILVGLFTVQALGNVKQYLIDSEVYIDGQLISSPRIVAMENKEAKTSQESSDSKTQLTQVIVEGIESSENTDVVIKTKLKVVRGTSTREGEGTVALRFGEKKKVIFKSLIMAGDDNKPTSSIIEVKSAVTRL